MLRCKELSSSPGFFFLNLKYVELERLTTKVLEADRGARDRSPIRQDRVGAPVGSTGDGAGYRVLFEPVYTLYGRCT